MNIEEEKSAYQKDWKAGHSPSREEASGICFRPMEERDLDQVAELEQGIFSMPWSRNAFQESLKLSHTLYVVAEKAGQILGYCGCYQMLEEAEITNVAVAEAFRKQGIGRGMLEKLMSLGQERGAFAYTLEVRAGNLAAQRLYESLGFESLGIRKNFYEKPAEDAVIMWRQWKA